MSIESNQKWKKYIKIPILYYLIIAIHEIGHIIGFIFFSEIKIIGFNYTVYSFGIVVTEMPLSLISSLMLLLLIPVILEFSFLYKIKSNKLWYVISLLVHRMDILYLINRVII